MKIPGLTLALLLLSSAAAAQAQATGTFGFYRSPTISGETVVFDAEGDLWSVPATGGLARRLTSHAAEESSPVISPDGRTLAFTARYEGPTALYTMPLSGGTPVRHTYNGDAANAMLVDHETASDGEAVADGFQRLGLGPLIGVRTWGGETWLSGVNTLSDGGIARAPMSGVYGPEAKWLIEQEGVIPDIIVDNRPHATFNGKDAQLDAAIAYLQKKIAEDPRPVPRQRGRGRGQLRVDPRPAESAGEDHGVVADDG